MRYRSSVASIEFVIVMLRGLLNCRVDWTYLRGGEAKRGFEITWNLKSVNTFFCSHMNPECYDHVSYNIHNTSISIVAIFFLSH